MAATADPEDGDLISALDTTRSNRPSCEEREKRRVSAKAVQAKYKEADAKVKEQLAVFALGDDEIVRAGRFRIKSKRQESRSVAFETSPSKRITISLLDDE